jgi:hypothetical protein
MVNFAMFASVLALLGCSLLAIIKKFLAVRIQNTKTENFQ